MPARNSVKEFVEGGYYHVYNRGVNKNDIFLDHKDYYNFLWLVREYLLPDHPNPKRPRRIRHGVGKEVRILCYCLMPNHFHFLIKQISLDGVTKLLRRICTDYVTYFNHRHNRSGTLFQGTYKAASVESDEYLMQVSSYIHRNPLDIGRKIDEYEYSSFQNYLGKRNNSLLDTDEILSLFKTNKPNDTPQNNYENFVNFAELSNNEKFRTMTIDSDQG